MPAWILLALAQAAPAVEVRLSEVPAAEGRGSRFVVEGKAAVPDEHTLIVYLYYERLQQGAHLLAERAVVRQGAFRHELSFFKDRTLRGDWFLTAVYDPNLQFGGGVDVLGPARAETRLVLGTEAEAAEDRRIVMARLAGEFKALDELGQEVLAKSSAQPRPEPAEWKTLVTGWKRRAFEIQRRALPAANPDYRAVGIAILADSGIENLSRLLHSAMDRAARGESAAAAETLTVLSNSVAEFCGTLSGSSPSQAAALLTELRALVSDDAGPLPPRRRRFHEIVQALGKAAPQDRQDLVLELTQAGTRCFAALADQDLAGAALKADVLKAVRALETVLKP